MTDWQTWVRENEQVVIQRPTTPTPPHPHPHIFRPPWLGVDTAGQFAAIVGAVCVALGAPSAVVGLWVPSWLPMGLWVTGLGLAALVLGLVAVIVSRRR
jgi:hypothetical protein